MTIKMTQQRILVVDDSHDTCKLVEQFLSQYEYAVDMAFDATQAIAKVHEEAPALILLDIGLPDIDGLTLIKVLEKHQIDIILLSGEHNIDVKVQGLELGAQDYITKPFHLRELLARVNTVISRRQKNTSNTQLQTAQLGDWLLDVKKRQLYTQEHRVQFTSTEYKLLYCLLSHANEDVSREQISQFVYNAEWDPNMRRIDTLVYQLRQKLKQFPDTPTIKCSHNQGYTLIANVTWLPVS